MPVMDGFQLLEKIRTNHQTRQTPVIVMSQMDETMEQRALKMGADDFVSKPYNALVIKKRVSNVVSSYELKKIKHGLVSIHLGKPWQEEK